jgi:tetratricopeptide (TPR) repeat protein
MMTLYASTSRRPRWLQTTPRISSHSATPTAAKPQRRRSQKCRVALEKAVALDPSSYAAQAGLIEYYRRAPGMAGGGLAKAYAQAKAYRNADKIGGTLLLVELYRREAKTADIFAALDEALRANPDHYALLLNLGRTAADSGERLEDGARSLERCLTLEPTPRAASHATAWFYLGQIRVKQADLPAARNAFETALKLNPGYREAVEALERL